MTHLENKSNLVTDSNEYSTHPLFQNLLERNFKPHPNACKPVLS